MDLFVCLLVHFSLSLGAAVQYMRVRPSVPSSLCLSVTCNWDQHLIQSDINNNKKVYKWIGKNRFWRILYSEGRWTQKKTPGCCLQLRPHGLMVQSPLFKATPVTSQSCASWNFFSCFVGCVCGGDNQYACWSIVYGMKCRMRSCQVCLFFVFIPPPRVSSIWSAFLLLWRSCLTCMMLLAR